MGTGIAVLALLGGLAVGSLIASKESAWPKAAIVIASMIGIIVLVVTQ